MTTEDKKTPPCNEPVPPAGFVKFEKPYWGQTVNLTPTQIVAWLEGHRELMFAVWLGKKKN